MSAVRRLLILALLSIAAQARAEGAAERLRSFDALLQSNSTVELIKVLQSEPDSDDLVAWLRARAEEGHVVAQFVLGKRLFRANKREGLAWYFVANLNENLDMNQCKEFSRTTRVRRLLTEFELKIAPQEAGLWADAIDDSLKIANRQGIGKASKQPPWWICAPGEANPSQHLLYPNAVLLATHERLWTSRVARDRDTSLEIRFNLNLNPDHFRIWKLDEKYWKGKSNSLLSSTPEHSYFSAAWMDDDTLLFGGYYAQRPPNYKRIYDPIYRWDLSANAIAPYAKAGFGLCVFKGFVSYYVERDGKLFYREGEVGKEREAPVPSDEAHDIQPGLAATGARFRFQCRRSDRIVSSDSRSVWSLESGGRIKREGRFGDSSRAAEYHPENSEKTVVFDPFEGLKNRTDTQYWTLYPPGYSEYLDASWVDIVRGGPAIDPIPIWILHRNGKVERHDIPPGPWTYGSSYAPVRDGWVAAASSGLYLLRGDKVVKVLAGNVQGLRVAPSGCRVVLTTTLGFKSGMPMWVVDVCQKEDQQ